MDRFFPCAFVRGLANPGIPVGIGGLRRIHLAKWSREKKIREETHGEQIPSELRRKDWIVVRAKLAFSDSELLQADPELFGTLLSWESVVLGLALLRVMSLGGVGRNAQYEGDCLPLGELHLSKHTRTEMPASREIEKLEVDLVRLLGTGMRVFGHLGLKLRHYAEVEREPGPRVGTFILRRPGRRGKKYFGNGVRRRGIWDEGRCMR
jgi:hypothetical protein